MQQRCTSRSRAFWTATWSLMLLGGPAFSQGTPEPLRQLFEIRGETVAGQVGSHVAFLGDFDGDGFDDFGVSETVPYSVHSGTFRLHSGLTGKVLLEVDGDEASEDLGDRFGSSVVRVGDWIGGAADELLIGAPFDDDGGLQSGGVALVDGNLGAILARAAGDATGAELGHRLALLGDQNGDGYADVLATEPGSGRLRLLSGEWFAASAAGLVPTTAQTLWSALGGTSFGESLAVLADLNADAFPDVAVGSPYNGPGLVTFLDGATGAVLFELAGAADRQRFGRELCVLGDANGDGFDELIVGASGDDTAGEDAGRLICHAGLALSEQAKGFAPSGNTLFWQRSGEAAQDRFGQTVAVSGDVTGDGIPEVWASASRAGSIDGLPAVRLLDGGNAQVLYAWEGATLDGFGGATLAGGGDVNGDGIDDLLVGEPRHGLGSEGRALVLSSLPVRLSANSHRLAIDAGGVLTLSLDAGPAFGGQFYLVGGSATGTAPGTSLDGVDIPLIQDWYTFYTLAGAPELIQFVGLLDAQGRAQAEIDLSGGGSEILLLLQLYYAFVVIDPLAGGSGVVEASNAVPLSFFQDNCSVGVGGLDCNGNGVLDSCDIADGTALDCNGNGIPDSCDIASGFSLDLDGDLVPDECTQVIYVDVDAQGLGDGSSWADAHTDLQAALQGTGPSTQVWVAEGTYRPAGAGGGTAAAFSLRPGVKLFGGFAGGETSLAQRDPDAHPTVLSGDLMADDAAPGGSSLDNVWSVVVAVQAIGPDAWLDGFEITGGNASAILACDEWAVYYNICEGGGLYLLGSPTIRNCKVRDNFGGSHGGGVFVQSDAVFQHCVFESNGALQGGGAYLGVGSNPTFVNCEFRANVAGSGGGVYATGGLDDAPRFVNCLFVANEAGEYGGAFYCDRVTAGLSQCTLTGNRAGIAGGALWSDEVAEPRLLNSILWGNFLFGGSGTVEEEQLAVTQAKLHYCLVEGWSGALGGFGMFSADPLYASSTGPDGLVWSGDEDLRLLPGSPALDRGDATFVDPDVTDLDGDGDLDEPTPLDLQGAPRFQNDPAAPNLGVGNAQGLVPDVGAYEGT
jgi:hypothetical protein